MEEKFSVSLELMIEKFKAKAQQTQNIAKNVSNKIKENMSVKPTFDIDTTNVKLVESRMQELNQIVSESQEIIQYGIKYPAWASWNTETIQKAEKDLKNANAEIEDIDSSLSTMNTNLDKNSKSSTFFSNSFKNIQDGMNKSLKSAKRFTLSLFGIQSVYRMLSRASSSYLAQDTETSSKIQSAWIGLGSVFAPLLNTIANFTIKAVSYINVFIEALTGTGFLANAMSKSMNKAGKSAGKLSKILSGFDEITNLGDDSGGGASIDTSWTDDFTDVPLDENVVIWLENIAKKMKPIIETVKQIGGAIKDIWDSIFAPFFTFILDNWDLVGKDFIGLILLIGIVIDAATGNWLGIIAKLVAFIILYWDDIKNALIMVWDLIVATVKLAIRVIVSILESVFYAITEPFKNAWKTVKSVWDGAKQFFSGIKDIFVGIFTLDGNKIKNGLKQMLQGMGNIIIAFIEGALNAFLIPINAAIKLINKIPGVNIPTLKVSIPRIPKLDVGTPNVEKSGYAMIHEGEAVVPKKFNSDEYFSRLGGNNNNAKVESLLVELIDTLERKDMNAYISESEVGNASQNYRNKLSRIMGEELA